MFRLFATETKSLSWCKVTMFSDSVINRGSLAIEVTQRAMIVPRTIAVQTDSENNLRSKMLRLDYFLESNREKTLNRRLNRRLQPGKTLSKMKMLVLKRQIIAPVRDKPESAQSVSWQDASKFA